MMPKLKRLFFAILAIIQTVAVLLLITVSAFAYKTSSKWPNTNQLYYYLDPNNDARLGVADSIGAINAASASWNGASAFRLGSTGPYNPNGNTISAANFRSIDPCRPTGPPDDTPAAVTCIYANPNVIYRATMWFNVSGTYAWNTNGTITTNRRDVQTTATHEFGHWYKLDDNPPGHPEAIMTNAASRVLAEDDKQGATQMYGPWTGFERGQVRGEVNRIARHLSNGQEMRSNVAGYSGALPPELGPRGTEFGVPQWAGVNYEMMAGRSQAPNSYVYFTLFTSENDSTVMPQNYVTIQSGMKLVWAQRNYQQKTMSVDFEMTDGSTLRGSGLTDQYGIRVHPAYRGSYNTGQWYCFKVNLTPLAGKTIRRFLIGYDNGNNYNIGPFRGYFDSVQLRYPGSAEPCLP